MTALDDVDADLRQIITNLFMLIAQAHDYAGPATQHQMYSEIKQLLQNLTSLSKSANRLPNHLPVEIIEYVEGSRNPDIYTREFVELVMRLNQQLKGRAEAFAQFRDIFGAEIMSAIPEVKDEAKSLLLTTEGNPNS